MSKTGAGKLRKTGAKKSAPANGPTLAQSADRHVLYQKSVQAADVEVAFFAAQYLALRGAPALTMREDFCGTALLSTEWCKSDEKRTAIGVDLCADTLQWAVEHNLTPEVAPRVMLRNEDVCTVQCGPVDVVCAMNFSYCVFKTRDALRAYFANVHGGLNEQGIFALDLLGGTATCDVSHEERKIAGERAWYIWEQERFNPINHHLLAHIHFRFADRSRLDKAFTYDWRLWTLPELSELLTEAGFSKVRVYWEGFAENPNDPDSEYMVGDGEYREVTEVEQQESWLAYVIAER